MNIPRATAIIGAFLGIAVLTPAGSQGGKTTVPSNRPQPAAATSDPLAPASWIAAQPFIDGHRRTAASIGHATVCVFFFCGCPQCHAVAKQWVRIRSGSPAGARSNILTLVSFDGSASEARQFARLTGLGGLFPAPLICTDPDENLRNRYDIFNCPQVYVYAPDGRLVYSTRSIADTQKASPIDIASRAFRAAAGTEAEVSESVLQAPSSATAADSTADIGTVHKSAQPEIEHDFELTNRSASALTIAGARGTCDCVEVTLLNRGRPVDSIVVPPGGTYGVRMGVRLDGLLEGQIAKDAYVYGGASGNSILGWLHLIFRLQNP